ncbi:MAG: peptide ABC transporter permease [Pelagibacteraceae bacterium]|jgi:peptide/nickel transport system permease protein|nr:peptide ABC transporter permease [Pelagibacteraceae bacterium]|tara:strand:+ start:4752 stop:5624 length:873 start_codon:yes stop_codon:yes gene_type:complete
MTTITVKPSTRFARILQIIRELCSSPLVAFSLVIVLLFFAVGITADYIAPYDPIKIDIRNKLSGPSWDHWLGTDQLGRDVLSRLIVGTKIALYLAVTSVSIALIIGIVLGMIAAFTNQWIDWALLLVFDTVKSFPGIMFALTIVALFGPSVNSIVVVIVFSTFPSYARLVRTQVMSLRNSEFIEAQRAMGSSLPRILRLHILPNVIGPVLIVASMDVPLVIGVEAGLSFLGLGVRPPTPSWGSILNDGFLFIRNTPWIVFAAGLPLILTTVAFTSLGESLRDILDPKLRK